MNALRTQWIAIAFPAFLVWVFEFLRHRWFEPLLPGFWGNLTASLLVAAGVYGFVRYYTHVVSRAEQDLGRSRAEAAVLAERQRIAREMHDGVAQALFHLRVKLQEVEARAAEGALADVQSQLTSLQTNVSVAYDQVRAAISGLKQGPGAEDAGEALRRGALQAAGDLELDLHLDLKAMPILDVQALQHLLAIAQEALTNARRHGRATQVRIASDSEGLTITDNGSGFDPRQVPEGRFGLIIMAERARMLGGELQVEARPGQGARITLRWGVDR